MKKVCAACGEEFETASRKKKFCSDRCRLRSHRGQVAVLPGGAEVERPTTPDLGPVEAATLAELEDAKREGTAIGRAALVLARKLDNSHMETGSGASSLAKQLQVTLAAALEGANQTADPVDELRALRDKKRGVAG